MRNGVGMWGLRLVLLAILVVLVLGAALFSSAGSEVWSEQRAQATLLPGTSDPGRGELTDGLAFVRQSSASPVSVVVWASTRWSDLGVAVVTTKHIITSSARFSDAVPGISAGPPPTHQCQTCGDMLSDRLTKHASEATGDGATLIWWQATGDPGGGVIVPLWDLLAITVMVVTFGVLVGSWTRRGH